SSLGGAIGAAVSLAVFTAMAGTESSVIGNVIEMQGRQDNVALRQAGMFALAVNLMFLLLAIVSITVTVPKGGGSRDLGKMAPSPAPAPQLPPDDAKAAILARLSALPLSDLELIEKQAMLQELGKLQPEVLKQLISTQRQ
ncbi:MAG: MFS transporter, partial [Actinomycetales bacterium]|nr:MFS transporter [Actinomycetales bacterium]